MTTKTEPAGQEAYIGVTKAEMTTSLAYEQLRSWFADNGSQPIGAPRQIFLVDPHAVGSDDVVYELAVPLRS